MKIRLRRSARRMLRPAISVRVPRKAKLDRALYMRPVKATRIGHVNTSWSVDGWYRHGVPIGKSLLLPLKCGHIKLVPQWPVRIRRRVYCRLCFMLWSERQQIDAQSKSRIRKRQTQKLETDIMAKKTARKTASNDDRRGRKMFAYVKDSKNVQDGTIGGVVLTTIRKMRQATVHDIADRAKAALKEVTSQDPLIQTGVWLNRLRAMGAVKKVKTEAVAASGGKKSVKLHLKRAKAA